jgi:hypothetical protein
MRQADLKFSFFACIWADIDCMIVFMKQNSAQSVAISAVLGGLLLLRPCGA